MPDAELANYKARLRRVVEYLESRHLRQRRDAEGAEALIRLIGTRMSGRAFLAADVLASGDPELLEALHATGIMSKRRVGNLLRDVRGHTVAGFAVRQIKRGRRGWSWIVEQAVTVTVRE